MTTEAAKAGVSEWLSAPRFPGDTADVIGYARRAGRRDGTRDGERGLPRDALRGEGEYGTAYDAAYRDAKAGR